MCIRDRLVIGTPSYSEALMISGGGGSITLQAEDIYMTGALDMGYCRITSLEEPWEDSDAATKGYVDSLLLGVNSILDDINGEVV